MERNEKLQEELCSELLREIEGLKDLEQGSSEMASATKSIAQMYEVYLNDKKLDIESAKVEVENSKLDLERDKYDTEVNKDLVNDQYREAQLETEKHDKEIQLKEQKKDRWGRYILEGVGLLMTLGMNIVLVNKCLKFEETGTIAANTSKNILGKVLNPFKKK